MQDAHKSAILPTLMSPSGLTYRLLYHPVVPHDHIYQNLLQDAGDVHLVQREDRHGGA